MINKSILGFLFALLGMFGFAHNASAQNAILYFVPATGTFAPGQTFQVSVMVDPKGEGINAVAAHFSYPESLLEAVEAKAETGLIEFYNEAGGGVVKIDAAKAPPIMKVASVTFRVKPGASGTAQLAFVSSAAAVRNSDNRDVLNRAASPAANYTIQQPAPPPPPVRPPTPLPTPTPTPMPTPTPTPTPVNPQAPPLEISEIYAELVGNGEVILSWKTNRKASSEVAYGPIEEKPYAFSVFDGEFTFDRSLKLEGVDSTADTAFQIVSRDESGQEEREEGVIGDVLVARQEQAPSPPVGAGQEGIRIGEFTVRPSVLFLLVLFPVFAIAWIGFLLLRRMRSQLEV